MLFPPTNLWNERWNLNFNKQRLDSKKDFFIIFFPSQFYFERFFPRGLEPEDGEHD